METTVRNIRITVEYDGTDYNGWQLQPESPTIQGELEKAIHSVTGTETRIIGSGRTDSGVHALGQVANFKSATTIDAFKLMSALNHYLPPDIVVKEAEDVPLNFHSQYAAKRKTYRYLIYNGSQRPALERNRQAWIRYPLDLGRMRNAATHLIGTHDFKSFASASRDKNTVRTVHELSLDQARELFTIEITANGFLYNMVRAIAGTLVDVGRDHIEANEVLEMLRAKDRESGGPVAPACGLYLVRVCYD